MTTQLKRPELLMPAGSLEKLKTAILYGADAVYAGTPDLSLRTKSSFSLPELREGIRFVHERGKKIYLTLNLFSHNSDIEKLPAFLDTIRDLKPDGLIIADPGVFQYMKEHAPELELHISTQANVCSALTVDFWKQQGASLVVLAREVSFEELKQIRAMCPDIKLEAFIHGAMCMTYSGRCLLSNFMAERRSNQGNCAQSCRWNYKMHIRLKDGSVKDLVLTDENKELFEFLMEEDYRPGDFLPIEEDNRGSYILNSKDLCLMPKLKDYLGLGIESFKVEGRNKTAYYAGMVARAYRRAIDAYYENPTEWKPDEYLAELYSLQSRGYTLAFHDGRLTNLAHNFGNAKSISEYEFAGFIREWQEDGFIYEVKNTTEAGELLAFISPHQWDPIRVRLPEYIDAVTGEKTEKLSPGQGKAIKIPCSIFKNMTPEQVKEMLPVYTLARKRKRLDGQERSRLLLDIMSQKAEINQTEMDPEMRAELLEKIKSVETEIRKPVKKGPKLGTEGCCGKACNGCLIYWEKGEQEKEKALVKEE